jgi:hypothetical protein
LAVALGPLVYQWMGERVMERCLRAFAQCYKTRKGPFFTYR